jgi:hypothetical protein
MCNIILTNMWRNFLSLFHWDLLQNVRNLITRCHASNLFKTNKFTETPGVIDIFSAIYVERSHILRWRYRRARTVIHRNKLQSLQCPTHTTRRPHSVTVGEIQLNEIQQKIWLLHIEIYEDILFSLFLSIHYQCKFILVDNSWFIQRRFFKRTRYVT